MILSASRRTDIPAFHADWLFDRFRAGFVDVSNPLNPRQVRRIGLTPEAVDGIVFWSKNPSPMLSRLSRLDGFATCFQFTLNDYGTPIEPAVPVRAAVVETFRRLSGLVGPDRVIWRYDPILLSDHWTVPRHLDHFRSLAAILRGRTGLCTVSFVDIYRKNSRLMKILGLRSPDNQDIHELAAGLSGICGDFGLQLETCAEALDLSAYGIGHARCVDAAKIAAISGRPVTAKKDQNQRPACGCSASVDIGTYSTCGHGCVYCYAGTASQGFTDKNSTMKPGNPGGID